MAQKVNSFGFRIGSSLNWLSFGVNESFLLKVTKYIRNFFLSEGFLLNHFYIKKGFDSFYLDIEIYPIPVSVKRVSLIPKEKIFLFKQVLCFLLKTNIKVRIVFLNRLIFKNFKLINNWREGLGFLIGICPISSLIAASVANDLEKSKEHIKVLETYRLVLSESFSFWSNYSSNLAGCCIQVKGRLSNSDRSKTVTLRKGAVSLNKIASNLDYHYKKAYTPFGIFGIKVWVSYKK